MRIEARITAIVDIVPGAFDSTEAIRARVRSALGQVASVRSAQVELEVKDDTQPH